MLYLACVWIAQDYSSKILPLVLQEGIYYIDKKASITIINIVTRSQYELRKYDCQKDASPNFF